MTGSKKNIPLVIARRELSAYFTSPMAYIVIGLFLIFSGLLSFLTFFFSKRAELRMFFETLPLLFSFVIPALTMRMLSEEKRSGTIETLVTLPVTSLQVILGKYIALLVSSAIMLVPTLFYVITCAVFGNPDFGPIIGGYIGSLFLAAAFCAIGLFCSSITQNQIIAFFIAFSICIILTVLGGITVYIPGAVIAIDFTPLLPGSLVQFVMFISASSHFESISRGIIDSRDVIYFVSVAAIFLALTVRVVKNAKRG